MFTTPTFSLYSMHNKGIIICLWSVNGVISVPGKRFVPTRRFITDQNVRFAGYKHCFTDSSIHYRRFTDCPVKQAVTPTPLTLGPVASYNQTAFCFSSLTSWNRTSWANKWTASSKFPTMFMCSNVWTVRLVNTNLTSWLLVVAGSPKTKCLALQLDVKFLFFYGYIHYK